MKKYRDALTKTEKQQQYNALIKAMDADGNLDKIKRADQLKGKLNVRPTDPKKVIELNMYKSLEPILYLEPHKKLLRYINKIATLKARIIEENRAPSNAEMAMIAKYNE